MRQRDRYKRRDSTFNTTVLMRCCQSLSLASVSRSQIVALMIHIIQLVVAYISCKIFFHKYSFFYNTVFIENQMTIGIKIVYLCPRQHTTSIGHPYFFQIMTWMSNRYPFCVITMDIPIQEVPMDVQKISMMDTIKITNLTLLEIFAD